MNLANYKPLRQMHLTKVRQKYFVHMKYSFMAYYDFTGTIAAPSFTYSLN